MINCLRQTPILSTKFWFHFMELVFFLLKIDKFIKWQVLKYIRLKLLLFFNHFKHSVCTLWQNCFIENIRNFSFQSILFVLINTNRLKNFKIKSQNIKYCLQSYQFCEHTLEWCVHSPNRPLEHIIQKLEFSIYSSDRYLNICIANLLSMFAFQKYRNEMLISQMKWILNKFTTHKCKYCE